jgi:hypothetical protein
VDYGDPTADTDYAFCVYDDQDRLVLRAPLRAGAGWYKSRRGFMYQGAATGGGIGQAHLRSATRSRTAILLRGRGVNLITRVSRSNHNGPIRAQLQGGNGCWETAQMMAQTPPAP